MSRNLIISLITSLPFALAAYAAAAEDFAEIPLESLMELKVTSVSKKVQPITNAAAAIFVITQEDIRRSGATTIAEALRMAPGVQVAKVDSGKWAITARGLNGRFSNKLLVLMDGRSLYTPFFTGVYWEVQDTVMEDIDRIEVIRGPGAALWGSNAVNGVINIITKSAADSKGVLVSAGGGTYERGFATGRYGADLSDNTSIRLFAKHNERANGVDAKGDNTNDSWGVSRGGFRLDSRISGSDTVTMQGDYYRGAMQETYNIYRLTSPYLRVINSTTDVSGGNLLGRWQKTFSETSNMALQAYIDHTERNMLVSPQKLDTFDLDFQHRFAAPLNNDIVWGVGYRFSHDDITNTETLSFAKSNVDTHIFSSFIHDELTLIPDKLSLIFGTRLEHNEYSRYELQPNGRILYTPTPHQTVWAAIARAVRTPTHGEQDITYNYRTVLVPGPAYVQILGNHSFKSEELISYEIGYRTELFAHCGLDISVYHNDYSDLRVLAGPPIQFKLSNNMHGFANGLELSVDWTPTSWWRLQTTYSYEQLHMFLDGTSVDVTNKGNAQGDTPVHQFSVRSGWDLPEHVTFDLWLRGVDKLASVDNMTIPGYVTLDARLAWKPIKNIEVSLVGQNLLTNHHPEFIPEYINTQPSEISRSVYGKLTWKY